ncbi:hypothetical protein [Brevibacillus sp. MS2.2]|uniref:hypothetical protein n=1 Tax=Brevibacillus sp. MS2.2 TaxID=2738981 RepID=UPI00156B4EDA|nr:hypothetical protein [Brevibacillus sp. MS2.2]NRR23289.1 hypothetical protein [Brevibacillus sp. MS2.2]
MLSFKKKVISFVTIIALTCLLPLSISANESNLNSDEIGFKSIKIENLEVTVFDDGRVKGIEYSEELSRKDRRRILELMHFTEQEINRMPEGLQEDVIRLGGVKVDTTIEDFVHIYTDLEGNDHIVTDENNDEVDKIRQKDLEIIAQQSGKELTITPSAVRDGKFYGSSMAVYMGKSRNGRELEYHYLTEFEWSARPWLYFVDTIANTWQNHTTGVSRDGRYVVRPFNGNGDPMGGISIGLSNFDDSNPLGTKADVDLARHDGIHEGWLNDVVRIPDSEKGRTGQFASAYVHSYSLDGISINFKYLGYQFSGTGDKWSWKTSFEIGKDSK